MPRQGAEKGNSADRDHLVVSAPRLRYQELMLKLIERDGDA